MLSSDWLFFVDFSLSREEEYLERRQAVKYLRNLRVLILKFYPIFHTLLFDFDHVNVDFLLNLFGNVLHQKQTNNWQISGPHIIYDKAYCDSIVSGSR